MLKTHSLTHSCARPHTTQKEFLLFPVFLPHFTAHCFCPENFFLRMAALSLLHFTIFILLCIFFKEKLYFQNYFIWSCVCVHICMVYVFYFIHINVCVCIQVVVCLCIQMYLFMDSHTETKREHLVSRSITPCLICLIPLRQLLSALLFPLLSFSQALAILLPQSIHSVGITGITGPHQVFHVGYRNWNSDPHLCIARALTSPHLSPQHAYFF